MKKTFITFLYLLSLGIRPGIASHAPRSSTDTGGGGGISIDTINQIAPDSLHNFTITPGTGVIITEGSNSITIAAPGGESGIGAIYGDDGEFVTGTTVTISGGSTGLTTDGISSTEIELTGILEMSHGGTNANLTPSNGGILYSTSSASAILPGTATANQVLLSGSNSAPSWSEVTYPSSTTANGILYSSADDTVSEITTANNGVLVTSNAGIPSWLANGTAGQVLTANSSAPPSWQTQSVTYYSLTPYIVGSDVNSAYSTISAAVTAASAAGASNTAPLNIYIKPGLYTENITLPAGVNLIGFDTYAFNQRQELSAFTRARPYTFPVRINGSITTSGSGNNQISGLSIQRSSAGNGITHASSGYLILSNVQIDLYQGTLISLTPSGTSRASIACTDCTFTSYQNTCQFLSVTGGSAAQPTLSLNNCFVRMYPSSGSETVSTITNSGFAYLYSQNSYLSFSINVASNSGIIISASSTVISPLLSSFVTTLSGSRGAALALYLCNVTNAITDNSANSQIIQNYCVSDSSYSSIALNTNIATSLSDNTVFFSNINTSTVTGSPVLVSSTNQLGIATSSARYKTNIQNMEAESLPIMRLRPVTFNYTIGNDHSKQFGLIAEEVAELIPEIVMYNNEGYPETVQYHVLPSLILNELQKMEKRISRLEEKEP